MLSVQKVGAISKCQANFQPCVAISQYQSIIQIPARSKFKPFIFYSLKAIDFILELAVFRQ
jgi:hypothetical protein